MEKYKRQRESSVKSIYSNDEYNELLDKIRLNYMPFILWIF